MSSVVIFLAMLYLNNDEERFMDRYDIRKIRSIGFLYYLLKKEKQGHKYKMSMDPQKK